MTCLVGQFLAQDNLTIKTTGYDCGIRKHNQVDISSYSTIETKKCDINEKNVNISHVMGQIVQKQKVKKIMVSQCKIKLRRTVHRCSLFGYLEPVENGVQEYLLETSREQCKRLHETG